MQVPDSAARERALDLSHSCLVQAPAGSGKTTLLTQRFLKLLTVVEQPEHILAITFTRKAAAEMAERICHGLQQAAEGKQDNALACAALARDKEQGWQLLENPGRLRLMTMDSFSKQLVLRDPIGAGMSGQSDIATDPTALYHQAAQLLLADVDSNLPWQPHIAALLTHLDNRYDLAERLLADMLSKRDTWLPGFSQLDYTRLREQCEAGLREAVHYHIQACYRALPTTSVAEATALLHYAASTLQEKPDHAVHACDFNQPFSDDLASLSHWQALASLVLDSKGHYRRRLDKRHGFPTTNKEMKARATAFINSLADNQNLQQGLQALVTLPPLHYSDAQWQILETLLSLLPNALACLQMTFQQQAQTDFFAVNQGALNVLDSDAPGQTLLRLDNQIQHLLVDEYQDTSYTQYRLLEQLTDGWQPGDGRSLFLVGDPMQSIYRFRGAEVSLFLYTQQHGIGHTQPEFIRLTANFRSQGRVIDWLNDALPAVFPREDNLTESAIRYTPSHSMVAPLAGPAVTAHALDKEDDLTGTAVADLVQQCLQRDPEGSIAILLRNKSHARDIITALQVEDIPFNSSGLHRLMDEPAMADLLMMTECYLYPTRRIAWLSFLRAPWCGLSLDELTEVSQWTSLAEIAEHCDELPETTQKRLLGPLRCLQQAWAARSRRPLAAILETLWLQLGGASLETDATLRETYFNELGAHVDKTLYFDFARFRVSLAKQFIDTGAPESPIHLLTMHKAKGLEYDTVILPYLEKTSRSQTHPLLHLSHLTTETGTHALLAPISAKDSDTCPIAHYCHEREKRQLSHEQTRLLYVALTRAKKHIHLLANIENKEDYRPPRNSLLAKLWPATEPLWQWWQGETVEEVNEDMPHIRRFSAPIQPPVIEIPGGEVVPAQDFGPDMAALTGTFIHGLLEHGEHYIAHYDAHRELASFRPHWCADLSSLGVPLCSLQMVCDVAEACLKNVATCSKARWIFSSRHTERHAEWPLVIKENNKTKTIRLDRTFIDSDNTRWIIDFKTVAYAHIVDSRGQMNLPPDIQSQCHLYAGVLRQFDPRTVKVGLYFLRDQKFVEIPLALFENSSL